jgi:hypothetical protein
LRDKLIAPASQTTALFKGRLFEIAPAIKPLLRGNMTEQGCKLMVALGVVINGLDNLEAAFAGGERSCQATRQLWRESSRLHARWRGAAMDAGAGFRITMSGPLVIVGTGMAAGCWCEELAQRALGRYVDAVIREEMPSRRSVKSCSLPILKSCPAFVGAGNTERDGRKRP